MTDIILLNIKLKDDTYVKYRKAKSPLEKARLKSKLKQMEKDLVEWINEAKSKYYTNELELYKNDVKKTWNTIKQAIYSRRHKPKYPEFFKVNRVNTGWGKKNSTRPTGASISIIETWLVIYAFVVVRSVMCIQNII